MPAGSSILIFLNKTLRWLLPTFKIIETIINPSIPIHIKYKIIKLTFIMGLRFLF